MHVSDASLDEGLGLLRVLAPAERVAPVCKINDFVDQALSDSIEVDEQTSGVCEDVECLVEVLPMVNFLDKLNNNVRHTVDFSLLAHEVDLIMECLSNLEN